MPASPEEVTHLLEQYRRGDRAAMDRLVPLVYAELRQMAARYLAAERPDHTLQPTALVHEVYMRMAGQRDIQWQNRAHFLGCAAQIMRNILVDQARARRTAKRGAGETKLSLDEALVAGGERDIELVALDEALAALAREYPEPARVVELKFFGGLTNQEVAEVVGISTAKVERHWTLARAWLRRALVRGNG